MKWHTTLLEGCYVARSVVCFASLVIGSAHVLLRRGLTHFVPGEAGNVAIFGSLRLWLVTYAKSVDSWQGCKVSLA
jgi:hypothetical protein